MWSLFSRVSPYLQFLISCFLYLFLSLSVSLHILSIFLSLPLFLPCSGPSFPLFFSARMILFTYLSSLKCSLSPLSCDECLRVHTHTHRVSICLSKTHVHSRTDPQLWQWGSQHRPFSRPFPSNPTHSLMDHTSSSIVLGRSNSTVLPRGEGRIIFSPKWKAVHLEFGVGLHLDVKRWR